MGSLALIDLIRLLLIFVLAYLAYVDLRTFRLPDLITLPIIFVGLCFNGFSGLQFVDAQESILGALIGYLLLWLLNRIYRYIRQQDGIGMGDAKLLAGLGAWLGWHALPGILFIASVCGIIGGILWLRLNKQKQGSPFPFGPFLIFAGIIELLWPQLLQYLLLSNQT
jgi:leader peptidase (prepilin peptidase) / N-methyltransferase